jgi:hypothetical protein
VERAILEYEVVARQIVGIAWLVGDLHDPTDTIEVTSHPAGS